MNKRSMAVLVLVGGILGAAGAAEAQKLAVPGKTPANPALVVSIPDAADFWRGWSGNGLGKAVAAELATGATSKKDWMVSLSRQFAAAEKSLGYSLWPSDLFADTVTGVDIYFSKMPAGFSACVAANFSSPEAATAFVEAMKKEAKASFGISGGFTAETVDDKMEGKVRLVSFPAFQIHAALEDSTLLLSNEQNMLASAVKDEGEALFTSEYFKGFESGLENERGNAWFFGDAMTFMPEPPDGAEAPKGMNMAGMVRTAKDHLKLTTFVPNEEMTDAQKRYALGAPPPGEVPAMRLIPVASALSYGTNHFDGLAILDVILSNLDQPGMPLPKSAVEPMIDKSRETLGFDLRTDLLANLGPDLAFALTKVEAKEGMPIPSVGLLLGVGVKDTAKVSAAMKSLEQKLSPAAPPPPKKKPKKDATPVPTPTPVFFAEEHSGASITYFETAPMKALGYSPCWAISNSGKLLLSADRDTLKSALDAAGADITTSTALGAAMANMESTMNSLFFLSAAPAIAALEASLPAAAGEGAAEAQAGLAILKSVESVAGSVIFKSNGEKREVVVQTK